MHSGNYCEQLTRKWNLPLWHPENAIAEPCCQCKASCIATKCTSCRSTHRHMVHFWIVHLPGFSIGSSQHTRQIRKGFFLLNRHPTASPRTKCFDNKSATASLKPSLLPWELAQYLACGHAIENRIKWYSTGAGISQSGQPTSSLWQLEFGKCCWQYWWAQQQQRRSCCSTSVR